MIRTCIFSILLAAPAFADVKAPNGRVIECFCTDKQGARVELGEMRCLQVDGRMFMARCEMALNNPFWRQVSDGCLSSELPMNPIPSDVVFSDQS